MSGAHVVAGAGLADCAINNTCAMDGLFTDMVLYAIGSGLTCIWLVTWPIALWSVVAEPTGTRRGAAWALIVTALPFVGAVAFWTRERWMPHPTGNIAP